MMKSVLETAALVFLLLAGYRLGRDFVLRG